MKLSASIILLLILNPTLFGQASGDGFSVMPRSQREVLQKWIKLNGFYRLALESDCTNKEGLSATRD